MWLPIVLLLAPGAFLPPTASAQQPSMPPSSSVVELNLWTFRSAIADGRMHFVMFYVPWCRGCKRMSGQWDELAESVRYNRDIVVARFDCMQDESMCERLGIDRTPTLKLYLGGQELATYKADFYHVDLMGPFLRRMHQEHMAGVAAGRDESPTSERSGPAADGGGRDDTTSATSPAADTAAASTPEGPSNSDTGSVGPHPMAQEAAQAERPDGSGSHQPDVVRATVAQPGVYDKPASLAQQDGTTESIPVDGGGAGAGAVPVGGGGGGGGPAAAASKEGLVGQADHDAAAETTVQLSGGGEAVIRRGRHGGIAVEMLQGDKEEL